MNNGKHVEWSILLVQVQFSDLTESSMCCFSSD